MNRLMKLAIPWVVKTQIRALQRQSKQSRGLALLGGLGLGAGLMYFLDPDRGQKRRTMLRDSLTHTNEAAGKTARDLHRRHENKMA